MEDTGLGDGGANRSASLASNGSNSFPTLLTLSHPVFGQPRSSKRDCWDCTLRGPIVDRGTLRRAGLWMECRDVGHVWGALTRHCSSLRLDLHDVLFQPKTKHTFSHISSAALHFCLLITNLMKGHRIGDSREKLGRRKHAQNHGRLETVHHCAQQKSPRHHGRLWPNTTWPSKKSESEVLFGKIPEYTGCGK